MKYSEDQIIEMIAAALMNVKSNYIYTIQELKDEFPDVFAFKVVRAREIFEVIK